MSYAFDLTKTRTILLITEPMVAITMTNDDGDVVEVFRLRNVGNDFEILDPDDDTQAAASGVVVGQHLVAEIIATAHYVSGADPAIFTSNGAKLKAPNDHIEIFAGKIANTKTGKEKPIAAQHIAGGFTAVNEGLGDGL